MTQRVLAGEVVDDVVVVGSVVYESRAAPLLDDHGAVVGVIGVATDVTDRKRAELQLARAERLASMGMLAAGLAHEVNNPLAYLIGNLDLLVRDLATATADMHPKTRELFEERVLDAREGAVRVREIVRDLRAFSRVDDKRAVAVVDLRVALDAALRMAANEVRHRARLVRDTCDAAHVRGDEGRLGQLCLNLIMNASQAIPEGRADANEIRVALRVERETVVLEVSDTGVGMAPEVAARAFEPFFTTKPSGGGTGLGLSISSAIVEDLGGRISVESEPRRGTTFRVELPAVSSGGASAAPESPRNAAPESPRRGRVLVVDDEPRIVALVTALLEDQHDVTGEHNGHAARRRVEAGERFDVILCDLMMPDSSGMDLFDDLTRLAPDQARAMLFLSGGAFTDRARAFAAQHAGRVVDKPFDGAALVATVARRVR